MSLSEEVDKLQEITDNIRKLAAGDKVESRSDLIQKIFEICNKEIDDKGYKYEYERGRKVIAIIIRNIIEAS